ncbi:MAG: ATP-grasp domain-containing protein [Kiritimatiellae bacterium]|nr:ATP-grasp domain-containing protein [Kiritimatiellia bacterium]
MKGWLVYSPEGYALNCWFANRLLSCAAEAGIALELKLIPSGCTAEDWAADETLPDFALVRVIRPDVSAFLAEYGVRVVNNAETARIANDKWATYLLARELEIPVLSTEAITLPAVPACGFPCVVKSRDGHGGSEVFLVSDAEELARIAVSTGKREYVAQPLCDEPGKDVRVYALGSEVVAAVLRTSATDFRSNFKLGGEVEAVEPTAFQRDVVRRLQERLGFDFVGVDFIAHAGGWVLNEIEDVVGTRMLYATTAHDAADLLVRRLVRPEGVLA